MSQVLSYMRGGIPRYGDCACCGAPLVSPREGDVCLCAYCLPDVPTWELPLIAVRTFGRTQPPLTGIERMRALIRANLENL